MAKRTYRVDEETGELIESIETPEEEMERKQKPESQPEPHTGMYLFRSILAGLGLLILSGCASTTYTPVSSPTYHAPLTPQEVDKRSK